MEKEIETRFLEINKKELIKKLISLGAIDKGEEKLEEIIFHLNDFYTDTKSIFIRLRKTKDKIKLTYKKNKEQTVDSAIEIEFEISDLEKCENFLKQIGLKKVRKLEKFRHTFKLKEVTFDIDTWPKIPVYVEIEGPSVDSLKDICTLVGFDWKNRFDKNAQEVFKHYGYDLNKISVVTFNEFK